MKRNWTAVLCVLALAFVPTVCMAGTMNGSEQSVYSAASGTFLYEGQTYVAAPEYLAQLNSYLCRDDVDLTAEQASSAISQMYASVAEGVENGYIIPVSGNGSQNEGNDSNESENGTSTVTTGGEPENTSEGGDGTEPEDEGVAAEGGEESGDGGSQGDGSGGSDTQEGGGTGSASGESGAATESGGTDDASGDSGGQTESAADGAAADAAETDEPTETTDFDQYVEEYNAGLGKENEEILKLRPESGDDAAVMVLYGDTDEEENYNTVCGMLIGKQLWLIKLAAVLSIVLFCVAALLLAVKKCFRFQQGSSTHHHSHHHSSSGHHAASDEAPSVHSSSGHHISSDDASSTNTSSGHHTASDEASSGHHTSASHSHHHSSSGHTVRRKVRRAARIPLAAAFGIGLMSIAVAVSMQAGIFKNDTVVSNLNDSGYYKESYEELMVEVQAMLDEAGCMPDTLDDILTYEKFRFDSKNYLQAELSGKEKTSTFDTTKEEIVAAVDGVVYFTDESKQMLADDVIELYTAKADNGVGGQIYRVKASFWHEALPYLVLSLAAVVLSLLCSFLAERGKYHIAYTAGAGFLIAAALTLVVYLLLFAGGSYAGYYIEPDYLYLFFYRYLKECGRVYVSPVIGAAIIGVICLLAGKKSRKEQ